MKNFHPTGNCPVRDVLSRLGDKWSMLVLITLSANGTMRFSDIHKTIADVSQRIPHIQGLVDWALQQMSGIMESRVLHTS